MKPLTAAHPRWLEFCVKMQKSLNPEGKGSCDHTVNVAFEVLNAMGGIDIGKTLAHFRENGGYCDCEIIFNVILPSLDELERQQ